MRMMRMVTTIECMIEPYYLKFVPSYTNKVFVVSHVSSFFMVLQVASWFTRIIFFSYLGMVYNTLFYLLFIWQFCLLCSLVIRYYIHSFIEQVLLKYCSLVSIR